MQDPAGPRWLDEEEQGVWYEFAAALVQLPAALDASMQSNCGINQFEYLVLAALSMATDHTRRMSDLAVHIGSSPSRLSNVVGRLERRGWVERSRDPTDGRATLATLTEEGWAKTQRCAPEHVEEVRRLVFDALTKTQQRQLGQISGRILDTINPVRRDQDTG